MVGSRKQHGLNSMQWRAQFNLEKKKNFRKMLKEYSWLKRTIKRTIRDAAKYGYKTKSNKWKKDPYEFVSRVCCATDYGQKMGMSKDTCIVHLNRFPDERPTGLPDSKKYPYTKCISVGGKTEGFCSDKQH